MTQLGGELSPEVIKILDTLRNILIQRNFILMDATSIVTGKDFLSKIWEIILSVPMGIAILSNEMKLGTISNIFYELGILNALGKETIIVKTNDFEIPSDFIRTEYIVYDNNFAKKINKFIDETLELAVHYEIMGDNLDKNPNLAIDYYRRAYLITGNTKYLRKVKYIFNKNTFDEQSTHFIKSLLVTTKRNNN
jgi:hypothetical protein